MSEHPQINPPKPPLPGAGQQSPGRERGGPAKAGRLLGMLGLMLAAAIALVVGGNAWATAAFAPGPEEAVINFLLRSGEPGAANKVCRAHRDEYLDASSHFHEASQRGYLGLSSRGWPSQHNEDGSVTVFLAEGSSLEPGEYVTSPAHILGYSMVLALSVQSGS